MTRAAIYARFSSDLQDVRSIGDQVALCRAYAERQGWTVASIYADAAISGASTQGREAFGRMVADAEMKCFNLILAEDLSRLSRNMVDIETFRERLEFIGVELRTVADGVVTQMHSAFKGLMNAMQLKVIAAHTKRGISGRVRDGFSGGGLTYGYAAGAEKGTRFIVEQEAIAVRRIFADYVAGRSPRAIAAALNAEGVKPPRGREWLASSINGNTARGSGILGNTLYDGRMIWNRVSMRKVPGTNKRISRPNPQSEWQVTAVPQLRIVDAGTFAAAQSQKKERSHARPEQSRRPRHLLAGLLKCGCCGSAMVVQNRAHGGRSIYCCRRKEGGRCANAHVYQLGPIEQRVVAGLKAQLADPRAIERFLAAYVAERKRLAAAGAGKRMSLEKALAQAAREIGRIVDLLVREMIAEAEAAKRLPELRQRKEILEADLAAIAPVPNVVVLHPATVKRYLDSVADLAATLSRRMVEGHEDVALALRGLVIAVIVHPKKGEPDIEITGRLAALTGAAAFPQQTITSGSTAVARARYRRPPTPIFTFILRAV